MHLSEQYEDLELVERIKNDEEAAKQELYLRYYVKVERLCCYCLKSQEDGQDAAQDVFVHILLQKKINSYRGESKLWSWIRRVAINKCYGIFRKRKRQQSFRFVYFDKYPGFKESIPAITKTAEEQIEHQEEIQQLQQIIPQLPLVYKNAVQKIVIQDQSYKEASKQLGISVRTVGVHFYRAKQMLANLVQKKWRATDCIVSVAS